MVLCINLIRVIADRNPSIFEQTSILKLLVNRLISLLTYQGIYRLLQAAVIELLGVLIRKEKVELLAGADVIDLSLPILNMIEKEENLSKISLKLLSSAFDMLYFSC